MPYSLLLDFVYINIYNVIQTFEFILVCACVKNENKSINCYTSTRWDIREGRNGLLLALCV